jgi:hypothetical protein
LTETQTPTTNANGLVSIEIGGGTGFNIIDWAIDTYYIETKTDPTGGTTYTITGTSQLLSVPYALHAKTAESFTGTITETDPTFTSSEAANITATDITNLSNLSGTNTGDQDGSETKVTAGTNVTVTGSGTIESPYVVNATGGGTTLAIGNSYGGGIIFWLDASGQHGLIAAAADQSTGIQWYNGSFTTTGATLDAVYAGMSNTNKIITNQGTGSYAAQVCADYSVIVNNEYYDDWYLPSKYELYLLYLQKTAVGGFASADYWSSAEDTNGFAWTQSFVTGSQSLNGKDDAFYVRAVRAF